MNPTKQPRSRRSRERRGRILARGRRPALILAVGLLAVSLSGCIDADARGPPETHPVHAGPICTDRCAVPVEDGETRSHESSVARNPQTDTHILVGASAWIGGEATDRCALHGTSAEACLDVGPGEFWRHVSFDGGKTWDSAPFPGDVSPGHPLFTPGQWFDPNVAFLSDGTALYTGMYGDDGVAFDIFVARSHDGGLTWPEATILAEAPSTNAADVSGLEGTAGDQPFLAVGADDTLLVTWASYHGDGSEQQDLMVAVSRDGGVTWSDPVPITDECICRNGRPVITDDGTMFMTYINRTDVVAGGTYGNVHIARSDDGGTTWETWGLGGMEASLGADLAWHDGTLFAAYADMDHQDRQTTHVIRSDDGGATWSERVLGASEGPGQAIPALDAAPDGSVFVVHYETGPDDRPWVVATRIGPDGLTVVQELTEGPLAPHKHAGPIKWSIYGDYSGMFADQHGAIATWVGGDPDNADLMASFLELPGWPGGHDPSGLGDRPGRG